MLVRDYSDLDFDYLDYKLRLMVTNKLRLKIRRRQSKINLILRFFKPR